LSCPAPQPRQAQSGPDRLMPQVGGLGSRQGLPPSVRLSSLRGGVLCRVRFCVLRPSWPPLAVEPGEDQSWLISATRPDSLRVCGDPGRGKRAVWSDFPWALG